MVGVSMGCMWWLYRSDHGDRSRRCGNNKRANVVYKLWTQSKRWLLDRGGGHRPMKQMDGQGFPSIFLLFNRCSKTKIPVIPEELTRNNSSVYTDLLKPLQSSS